MTTAERGTHCAITTPLNDIKHPLLINSSFVHIRWDYLYQLQQEMGIVMVTGLEDLNKTVAINLYKKLDLPITRIHFIRTFSAGIYISLVLVLR